MTFAASGLERAKSLHSFIDSESSKAEALGRLTDDVSAAMIEQGLFSLLLPTSAGGLGTPLPEYFETLEEIGSADASAAWCMAICNATNLMFWRAGPDEGRAEVFDSGPVAMWTCLLPLAKSEPTQGGYRVSGKFGWGSGSALAEWVLVTEPLPNPDGLQWFRSYVIPKSDVMIVEDSWQVIGLKATHSVDYIIDGAFVPQHRSFEYPIMDLEGTLPMSTVESAAFHGIGMAAFASGIAKRAMTELVKIAGGVQRMKATSTQAEDEAVQQGLGEVAARLDAARGHYLTLLSEQDKHFREFGRTNRDLVEKCLLAANVLGRAAREVVIFAYDNAATGAIRLDNPIQKCLRDIFVGLKHPVFNSVHLRGLGKAMLGAEVVQLKL